MSTPGISEVRRGFRHSYPILPSTTAGRTHSVDPRTVEVEVNGIEQSPDPVEAPNPRTMGADGVTPPVEAL
jgi:hypothetical protein